MGVGLLVWIAAIIRHPNAFGPIEWLMALFWFAVAWPVYFHMLR